MLSVVLKNDSNLVVVLPTGGGKSLAWEGPAHTESEGTTVVLSPQLSLTADMVRRAREAGIVHSVFRANPEQSYPRSDGVVPDTFIDTAPHYMDCVPQSPNPLIRLLFAPYESVQSHNTHPFRAGTTGLDGYGSVGRGYNTGRRGKTKHAFRSILYIVHGGSYDK